MYLTHLRPAPNVSRALGRPQRAGRMVEMIQTDLLTISFSTMKYVVKRGKIQLLKIHLL